jgi:hypothetical protein
MVTHKGPASWRPRCTRSGSYVALIPVCHPSTQCNVPENLNLLQYSCCKNLILCLPLPVATSQKKVLFIVTAVKKLKNHTDLMFRVTGTEGTLAAVMLLSCLFWIVAGVSFSLSRHQNLPCCKPWLFVCCLLSSRYWTFYILRYWQCCPINYNWSKW